MSEPTAFPLDESKLPFKIPKDTKPREKIMKLGQMITDRVPAKLRRLTVEDLLALFEKASGQALASDRMLLG